MATISLATNALIDVDTLKLVMGEDQFASTISDDYLTFYINTASQVIADYCERTFLTPLTAGGSATTCNEIFSGDGEHQYYVKTGKPINSTPTIYYWNGSSWSATTYTSTYDSTTGRIYFTDGNRFDRGTDNWKVVYTFGYLRSAIPGDLQYATAVLCQHLWSLAKKTHLSSESVDKFTTSYRGVQIPANVAGILDKYRMSTYG